MSQMGSYFIFICNNHQRYLFQIYNQNSLLTIRCLPHNFCIVFACLFMHSKCIPYNIVIPHVPQTLSLSLYLYIFMFDTLLNYDLVFLTSCKHIG
ncbi:hypothetical protein BpHYR1_048773 [Brachionus plicatilis]|uniref:Uncharacterized protein n=1 Tax=Brachionus plicatilis TaxID=10195 RepID=A0A3M7PI89_BRAPC|nr:hypothetical protein BpHYR1_048773 [Brachionus plicatilis]